MACLGGPVREIEADIRKLAASLRLRPAALLAGARSSWHPQPAPAIPGLHRFPTACGDMLVNSYLVVDPATGEALFAGSMGGAPPHAWDEALFRLRERILTLPDETILCPGPGPLTTLAEEKLHNPFAYTNVPRKFDFYRSVVGRASRLPLNDLPTQVRRPRYIQKSKCKLLLVLNAPSDAQRP